MLTKQGFHCRTHKLCNITAQEQKHFGASLRASAEGKHELVADYLESFIIPKTDPTILHERPCHVITNVLYMYKTKNSQEGNGQEKKKWLVIGGGSYCQHSSIENQIMHYNLQLERHLLYFPPTCLY